LLGVPNTGDRVAQTAAAMLLEEKLEPVFYRDSYGYRPGRSAQWPCFKALCDIVTVLWLMMVLRGSLRTGGCRTGSRSGC
jgi:hypothetical protein